MAGRRGGGGGGGAFRGRDVELVRETRADDPTDRLLLLDPRPLLLLLPPKLWLILMTVAPDRTGFVLMHGFCSRFRTRLLLLTVPVLTADRLLEPTVTRPSVMLPVAGAAVDFLSRAPFLISDIRADMSPAPPLDPEAGGEERDGLTGLSSAGGLEVGSGGGGGEAGDMSFGFCGGGGGAGPLGPILPPDRCC